MHPDWLVPAWPAQGAGALMTTRRGGFSAAPYDSMNLRPGIGDDDAAVARNQALLEQVIGATPVWLEQVHGARVVRLGAADALAGAPLHQADASVTTELGIACAVQVADCLPVLFAAPGAVGAAHAGWRGLAGGVRRADAGALCEAARCDAGQVRRGWAPASAAPLRGRRRRARGLRRGARRQRRASARRRGQVARRPAAAGARPPAARRRARVSGGSWCTVEDASRFFSFRRDASPAHGRRASGCAR
jgi:copper oxidase (laccase) domain-containing protein